jgi:7 transmembrane receptor (rhodopsin family)
MFMSLFAFHTQIIEGEMDLNETSLRNVTKSRSMASLMDPDANVTLGFWLNGVGIIVIGVMGIMGNLASIRVLSNKRMRSSVNFILIALSSTDLILIVTSILLFGLMAIYPYTGSLKDYYFIIQPKIAGIAYPIAMIAQTISVYMTFLISFERYIAVCHPLKARAFCTQERTKLSIFVIIAISILYNSPKFFEIHLNEGYDDQYGIFYYITASSLRVHPDYIQVYINWMYCIFINLIPLTSITFFNLMIYSQVRVVNRLRLKLTSKERQDIKLTSMLFCVVIVFLSCNFLAVLTNVLESFYYFHNDTLTKLSNFSVTLNSSVNFIIYVVLVKKFRLIFIRQLKSLFSFRGTDGRKHLKFTKAISSSDSEQTTNDLI